MPNVNLPRRNLMPGCLFEGTVKLAASDLHHSSPSSVSSLVLEAAA